MKKESIKNHLKPYSIIDRRITTINNAFASAIAPSDEYNEEVLINAIKLLGQDPQKDLLCVYCGKEAQTWDHVFGLVSEVKFSGYGHVLGNLLPCCQTCNSRKGNRDWDKYVTSPGDKNLKRKRETAIKQYLKKYLPEKLSYEKIKGICPNEIQKYESIQNKVIKLMKEADRLAVTIRAKIKGKRIV